MHWWNWWHVQYSVRPTATLSVRAANDIMLRRWCSVSLQHALSASGPVQCFYSGTKPIMQCRGHAHTLMRETRKDTFFSGVDDSAAAAAAALHYQPNTRVNYCFLYVCSAVLLTHVLWTQTPSGFLILVISSGNISYLVKANYLSGSNKLLLNSAY